MAIIAFNHLLSTVENPQLRDQDPFDYTLALKPDAYQKIKNDSKAVKLITINDLYPEHQDVFINFIQTEKTNQLFQRFRDLAVFSLMPKATSLEQEEFLRSKRSAAFLNDLKDRAIQIVQLAMITFRNGARYSVMEDQIYEQYHQTTPNYALLGMQTKASITAHVMQSLPKELPLNEWIKIEQQLYSLQSRNEENKNYKVRAQLFNSRCNKTKEAKEEEIKKTFSDYEDLYHYFLFLSAKLNMNLNEITPYIPCDTNLKAYEAFKEKKRISFERQRELEIERSFLPTPVTAAKPKKSKPSKNRRSTISQPKNIQPIIVTAKVEAPVAIAPSIFSDDKVYVVDKRITRWFSTTIAKIKKFTDRIALVTTHPYQSLENPRIEEQRLYHCLPGVHRLMSLTDENLQKFSSPYQFMHNGSLKNGRCFSAKLKHGKLEEEGMIYIGVDSHRIYHANFVSFRKKECDSEEITPQDFCMSLMGLDSSPNIPKDEEWIMPDGYAIDLKEDKIIWTIGSGKELVQYELSSLF